VINHLVENSLKGSNMLANVVVVEKGWIGGRGFAVGFGDREAMFIRGEEVPVASNEEEAV
jgi:hypothetical protein